MTLKLRFALLLSLLLAGLAVSLVVLQQLERNEAAEMLRTDRHARAQLLNHWLDATSRALPQFAGDLAQSEDFAALLASPPADASREKIAAALHAAGAAWLWVLREDGTTRFHAAATGRELMTQLPLPASEFVAIVAETPQPRFFATSGADLLEVVARRLHTGARDWIIVARLWNETQLRALGALTESRISLAPPHETAHAPAEDFRVTLVRPLADWRGHPLRVLRLEYDIPEIERAVQADSRQSQVFIAFGLLLLTALGLALHQWVLRPLRRIGDSLGSQNASLVADLSREKSELGRVAQLVLSSFRHRAELEREVAERTRAQQALEQSEASLRESMEERARLGRDLHDGVIQSLYAAGMGLAGIRMQLTPDQVEAATRLEQTRAALNETIHDVRNFIVGLEPEALRRQTFSQAIAGLLEAMRSMREFHSTIDVDEALADRLSLAQRVHALQIAREAVSNALRHGEASELHVELAQRGAFAEFEVSDNGRGFDLGAAAQGQGLLNFAERARELGGELSVNSQPGQGTRVKLTFSPLIS